MLCGYDTQMQTSGGRVHVALPQRETECVFPSASVFERKQNLPFTNDNRSPCCLIRVHHVIDSLTALNEFERRSLADRTTTCTICTL